MYSNFMNYMMIISFLFFIISNIIMIMSMIISKKKKMNFEKMSPFECGFNPLKFQRMPFSMRFFLITIIFLIFDVEIALILPMIMSMKISNYIYWKLTMMMFFIILLLGLFYEWYQGALNWI